MALNIRGLRLAGRPRAARRFAFDRTPSTFAGTGSRPGPAASCRQSIAPAPDSPWSVTISMIRR
ncbi:hypothetical protein [Streptomyces virginiae]|uniref:Uncharacterized protein n=1 Tax=Streptomyces virginiae TaxID=1961 RepID=A0ABZ1T6N9_STRVG|nr:hypothetical protein [Streptomyces virginiae]